MKYSNLVLIAIAATLASACASNPAKTDAAESAPAAKSAPAKESAKKEAAAEGAIVGKPAAGSKFAKLKIGMNYGGRRKADRRGDQAMAPPHRQSFDPVLFRSGPLGDAELVQRAKAC